MGRHVAARPARTRRGRRVNVSGRSVVPARGLRVFAGRLGGVISAITVGLLLAVAGSGGSYAYLSRATTVAGATLTAGSAAFTITATSPLAPTSLYPGSGFAYGTYTLTNTGDVPLDLKVDSVTVSGSSALAQAMLIEVAVYPAATACVSASYGQWSRVGSTVAGGLTNPAGGALQARDRAVLGGPNPTAVLCMRASLPASAPDAAKGSNAGFTIALGGAQTDGASWLAPARSVSPSVASASISVALGNVDALSGEMTVPQNWIVARLTLANTGSAPLDYGLAVSTAGSPTLPASTKLALWAPGSAACAVSPPGGAALGTLATTSWTLPAGATSGAVGSTVALCAATQLSGTLAQSRGKSMTATFTLTGRVGTAWVSTATETAVVNVAWESACTNPVLVGDPTITWTPVSGAINYRVYNDQGVMVQQLPGTATSFRFNFNPSVIGPIYGVGATTSLRVAPVEAGGESAGRTFPTKAYAVLSLLPYQTCA
jgi:hypothetical protein